MASAFPTPLGSPARGLADPPCLFLRDRLEEELVPKDPTVPEHKRFFPYARVALILDDESIKEVLHCWCPKCHDFREVSSIQIQSLVAEITRGESESAPGPPGGAILLFAILIYIGYPLLIDSFLRLHVGDYMLRDATATFTAAFVQEVIGPDNHQKFPRLAQKFYWTKYQFFVPEIHDTEYTVYPENTILPFVNEVVLGRPSATGDVVAEGGHGKVYSFEILEGYGGFKEFPGVRRFARKELYANTPEFRFTAERKNLFAVKKLQDYHLVKILAAYKIGDVYNLVFPLAEANLHRYLREPQYRAFRGARCIVGHHVWKQLLGIAEGLYKVQHIHEGVVSSTDSRFGYHFDLKPANILIEEGERLIITDFGQAFFKPASDSTDSRVVGMGGTEAYAPPELNDQGLGLNRRYDIWSLGCIFLEVLVFVLTGTDGLLELDRSRVSKEIATRHIDDKFYGYDQFGTCSLKSGVLDQIESMSRHLQDPVEKEFFQKFLDLVLHMLDVNPKTRFTSKNVFIYLSSILNPPHPRNNSDSSCATFLSTSSGIPVGNELITSFHTMSFRIENSWRFGPFQIIQDGTNLHVQTSFGNDSDRVLLGPRGSLRLIPDYALHNPTSYHFVDTSLSISPEEGRITGTGKCTFDCGQDLDATCCLQEVFLGQEVVQSFKIQTAKLSPYQKKLSTQGIRRSLLRSKRGGGYDDLGQASAIQLWQESSDADAAGMFESADSAKRRYFPNPSHRRIIIFYGQSILMLRMAKNFRLNEAPPNIPNSQCTLMLVPTAENMDRSFSASLLRKQSDSSFPSFSLVREAFEAEEENGRLECTSLVVTFHTPQEAKLFYDSYRAIKKTWREEMKSFEIARGRHGTGHFDFKRQ